MNILDLFKREKNQPLTNPTKLVNMRGISKYGADYTPLFTSVKEHYSMNLSAVFRAVDLISSTVAALPITIYRYKDDASKYKYFNHPAYYLLSREPNPLMSRYTFIKCMVINMLLSGNAYGRIIRDEHGEITELRLINSQNVNILYDKSTNKLAYNIIDEGITVDSCDMIHIQNIPDGTGIKGMSTLDYAKKTLQISADSENMASNFFSTSSLTGYLKIKTIGKSAKEQKDDARKSWANQINSIANSGIPVLDDSQEFVPLNVKDADIQLLESRKFNIENISRFFNVSPILLFDLSKNSYSSSEHASLQLLNDCIAPILERFELEFERKIFLPSVKKYIDVKFDESAMLRLDKLTQAEYFTKLLNIGVLSPNDIRDSLDMERTPEGDIYVLQVNTATFEEIKNRATKEPLTP